MRFSLTMLFDLYYIGTINFFCLTCVLIEIGGDWANLNLFFRLNYFRKYMFKFQAILAHFLCQLLAFRFERNFKFSFKIPFRQYPSAFLMLLLAGLLTVFFEILICFLLNYKLLAMLPQSPYRSYPFNT